MQNPPYQLCDHARRRIETRKIRPEWAALANEENYKLEYDPQLDAAYVTLAESDVVDSEEVKPGIVLDYDGNNRVVCIEILNVRPQLPDAKLPRVPLEV